MTRGVLLAAWLTLGLVPLLWWAWNRQRPDLWRAVPVPAALLDRTGAVLQRSGPSTCVDLSLPGGLPAPGSVLRSRSADGTLLAATGLRTGAFVLALPDDPVRERRDTVLAELGARLAHDINTPLGVLFGHLDLIAHEDISESARRSVGTCQKELLRLQGTAQDLLTLTRLRSGTSPRSLHSAGALAEEAAAGLLDEADRLGADLAVQIPQERVMVEVAEADLVRALRNLLANALRHGLGDRRHVGLRLTLQPATEPPGVRFAVWDSGAGFADAEELAQLMEPLARGQATTTPGSGLGLTIVREVLAGYGASLQVGAPPTGSELFFVLLRAT